MADSLVKPGTIVTNANGEVCAFRLTGTVFVSAFDQATQQGSAAHFSEAELLSRTFIDKLKKLSAPAAKHEIKVVGPEKLCKMLARILENQNYQTPKISPRENEVQLLFYPAVGRVRVEKEAAPKKSSRVRVLIVDDSKTIRDLLEKVFSTDPGVEVVGVTGQPLEVLGLIENLKPDVITMDIHMPDMDGVTLLKEVMKKHPTPTVMITSATIEDGPAVLTALECGAVDYIHKPSFNELNSVIPVIVEKIKMAASANIAKKTANIAPKKVVAQKLDLNSLIAIGSSTGGTEALRVVLTQLPKEIPPIVIVQHIPPIFSLAFAKRMAALCPFEVKEAEDGDEVRPGRVLIAPGGKHMEIKTRGSDCKIVISDAPPVNRFKPSVDVLFDSVVAQCKVPMIGVILTGMGADGARGLLKMRQAGAHTIAQSEKTCVVYGMPREAVARGAAMDVVDLERIPEHLVKVLSGKRAA